MNTEATDACCRHIERRPDGPLLVPAARDAAIYTAITEDKLSTERAVAFVSAEVAGAIATFVGTTRNHHKLPSGEVKAVVQLEYESNSAIALKQMDTICKRVCGKHAGALLKVFVAHRIGVVPVCEASIIVAVSSAHRAAAISAMSEILDSVKAEVAVWKKEIYADGSASWKENCECAWVHAKA